MKNSNNPTNRTESEENLTLEELRQQAKELLAKTDEAPKSDSNTECEGRKGLSVRGAMFHVKGKHLRRYYNAVDDVLRYVMYGTNQDNALHSALELQDFAMDELYERSQSHSF